MRILVPRLVDRENCNAQVLNTRALLARFSSEDANWIGAHYGEPDAGVLRNVRVRLVRLWRGRLQHLRMGLLYLHPADALFYTGREAVDDVGMRWRKRLYPRRLIIATLEGLAGTEASEKQFSEWAGHPVYCQRVDNKSMDRVNRILSIADHIVAISPFLAEMGRRRYGEKFSVLPLGVDTATFFPAEVNRSGNSTARKRVVSAGSFQARKRPEMFLELARRHPEADFFWYGDGGDGRAAFERQAVELGITNLFLPGALCQHDLAEAFRAADIFVMPSISEGVPKVTQEAAACGLPVVLFGFYRSPSVIDGENGYVVWDDDQLFRRVQELLCDSERAQEMGGRGADLAKSWDWNSLAPQWEAAIIRLTSGYVQKVGFVG